MKAPARRTFLDARASRAGRSARRRGARLLARAAAFLALASVSTVLALVAVTREHDALAFALALVALALIARAAVLASRGHRHRLGAAGERQVGRRLRRLRRHGWTSIHDVDRGAGNIDHIAAGPGGIITVETKLTRTGPREIAQARAHATWVTARTGRTVVAVLCVTRLDPRPRLVAGVWIVGLRRLPRFIRHLRGEPADAAVLALLVPRRR